MNYSLEKLNNKLSTYYLNNKYHCSSVDNMLIWETENEVLSLDKNDYNINYLIDNIHFLILPEPSHNNIELVNKLKKFDTDTLIYCNTHKMLSDLFIIFKFLNINVEHLYQAFVHYLNKELDHYQIFSKSLVKIDSIKKKYLINSNVKDTYDNVLLFYLKNKS